MGDGKNLGDRVMEAWDGGVTWRALQAEERAPVNVSEQDPGVFGNQRKHT